MKTRPLIWLIIGLLSGAQSSCRKPETAEELRRKEASASESANPLDGIGSKISGLMDRGETPGEPPFERTLVDTRGRELGARVFAKSGGQLALQRLADGAYFSISIATLSEDDRAFFSKMPDSPPEVIARYERARAGMGERRARWSSSLSSAEFESAKYGLPIYLLFTGSDWCPPCQSLERRVLASREFQAFADERLVLMKVDVPRGGMRSGDLRQLMTKHAVNSYPTVVILNPEGKEMGRVSGYSGASAAEYLASLAKRLE